MAYYCTVYFYISATRSSYGQHPLPTLQTNPHPIKIIGTKLGSMHPTRWGINLAHIPGGVYPCVLSNDYSHAESARCGNGGVIGLLAVVIAALLLAMTPQSNPAEAQTTPGKGEISKIWVENGTVLEVLIVAPTGVDHHEIRWSKVGDSWKCCVTNEHTKPSLARRIRFFELDGNSTYRFQVRGVNVSGGNKARGAWSDEARKTTDTKRNLIAVNTAAKMNAIRWDPGRQRGTKQQRFQLPVRLRQLSLHQYALRRLQTDR